jgi:hypothetical protein
MRKNRTSAHIAVVGKLPEGYIILCEIDGDEHSFLAKNLGISVECPHCGATRCSTELAQEYFLGRSVATASPMGLKAPSHVVTAE